MEDIFARSPDLRRVRDFVDNFLMRRIHETIFDLAASREFAPCQSTSWQNIIHTAPTSTSTPKAAAHSSSSTEKKKKAKKKQSISAKDERIHKHLANPKNISFTYLTKEEQNEFLYEESIKLFLQLPEAQTPQ